MNNSTDKSLHFKRLACGALSAIATVGSINFWTPAEAAQYDALCGGAKCTIVVTPTAIQSPYGSIPSSRVTYWGSSGESKTSVGTGVATTILFGGIGLLGFLAKNHQYNFTINGFDAEGKQVSMQFEFKNDKPAKLLMQELVTVTRLGMGQTRTVDEIKASENSENPSPGVLAAQTTTLGASKGNVGLSSVPKNCWSAYLEKNPAMKQWAIANPAQAAQNQKRFDAC